MTGRPKLQIDEEQLRRLAAMQCTYEEIAAFFECHTNTIRNRFKDIIEQERLKARASLRREMFRSALEGDQRMQVWLSKQYLGMAEKTEHSGETMNPLVIEFAEAKKPVDEQEG
jgi:hypothetical protein